MLKKTMAMAALVLMITSLFSGSLGRVQADAPVKIDATEYPQGLHTITLMALHAGKAVTFGTFGTFGTAGAAAADGLSARVESRDISAGADCVAVNGPVSSNGLEHVYSSKVLNTDDGRIELSSPDSGMLRDVFNVRDIPAGAVRAGMKGQVSSNGSDHAYSSMVVYMNDSRIKMPAPGMFWTNGGSSREVTGKMLGNAFEKGALSFDGKIAMFRTDSGVPDMYEVRWENAQAVKFGEMMPMTIFQAHLVIPVINGSDAMPLPPLPFPDQYVFDSDVMVDLANLSFTGGMPMAQDSQYDNTITAGETQWHSADISSAVKSVNVDLKWSKSGNPLKLTIYTPDGHILGPYDDSSDGEEDDRINLNIDNPSGVADGTWSMKVTDAGAGGTGAYYLKTY